jgi:predicted anti-sigma-YlaC factor YlaD
MKCPDVIGFLSPYLDSELDTTTTFQIQAHLGNCESCRKRFDQEGELEQRMVAALRTQPSAADDAMWNRIMANAVPVVRAPRLVERPRTPIGFRWLLLIASMLIVSSAGLGLGFSTYNHHRQVMRTDLASLAIREHRGLLEHAWTPTMFTGGDVNAAARFIADASPGMAAPTHAVADLRVVGSHRCTLGGLDAACVVYSYHGEPVTMFVIPRGRSDGDGDDAVTASVGSLSHLLVGGYRCTTTADQDRVMLFVHRDGSDGISQVLRLYDLVPAPDRNDGQDYAPATLPADHSGTETI